MPPPRFLLVSLSCFGSTVLGCGGEIEPAPPATPPPVAVSPPPSVTSGERLSPPPVPPPECAVLAGAKPKGSFVASGHYVESLKSYVDVGIVPSTGDDSFEIVFTSEPYGAYAAADAQKSGAVWQGFWVKSSLESASRYENGYVAKSTCGPGHGEGGSSTWQGSGPLRITRVTDAAVEGSIDEAPNEVRFVATRSPLPKSPNPLICCP